MDATRLNAKGCTFGWEVASDHIGRGRFSNVWKCEEYKPADAAAAAAVAPRSGGLVSSSSPKKSAMQPVCVKVFRSDRWSFEAFQYEVSNMQRLGKHPNASQYITTLIGSGVYYQQSPVAVHCWYSMPLEQLTLRSFVKNTMKIEGTAPDVPIVMAISRSLFRALEFIHREGFAHCDIKPANILIKYGCDIASDSIEVKLADFGASLCIETGKGGRGTIAFASPEMLSESGNIDTATDIWSAGVTIYEVLTGERLIDPEDMDCTQLEPTRTDSDSDIDDNGADDSDADDELTQEEIAAIVEDSLRNPGEGIPSGLAASGTRGSSDNSFDAEKNVMIIVERLFGTPPECVRKLFPFYGEDAKIEGVEYPIKRVDMIDLMLSRHSLHTLVPEAKAREITAFLVNCMRYKPEERLTAASALASHP